MRELDREKARAAAELGIGPALRELWDAMETCAIEQGRGPEQWLCDLLLGELGGVMWSRCFGHARTPMESRRQARALVASIRWLRRRSTWAERVLDAARDYRAVAREWGVEAAATDLAGLELVRAVVAGLHLDGRRVERSNGGSRRG